MDRLSHSGIAYARQSSSEQESLLTMVIRFRRSGHSFSLYNTQVWFMVGGTALLAMWFDKSWIVLPPFCRIIYTTSTFQGETEETTTEILHC